MNLELALNLLAKDPAAPLDLGRVVLLLARDEYPQLDIEAYLCEIQAMGREARDRVRGSLRSQLEGLCRYLFQDLGFTGNTRDYYDPRNSYFNEVMDRHTGLPITLSVLAMILGEQSGLRVEGIGLPGHFIARAVDHRGDILYFDPFSGGKFLTPSDCESLVEKATGSPFQATADTMAQIPLGGIIQRMLTNLKLIYLKKNDPIRAIRIMERLCQLNPDNPVEQRDLGICLLNANQPGKAILAFESFLRKCPDDASSIQIIRLLNDARGMISRWN